MLQRYSYCIRTSLGVCHYGRGSAVGEAKAGVPLVAVSPTVDRHTATGGPADLARPADNVCLRARLYGPRAAASRAGRAVAAAAAGDEL